MAREKFLIYKKKCIISTYKTLLAMKNTKKLKKWTKPKVKKLGNAKDLIKGIGGTGGKEPGGQDNVFFPAEIS